VNRKTFEVEIDGKNVELAVEKPSNKHNREAHFVYSRSVKDALEAGLPPRQSLDSLLRKQGLWDKEKEVEYSSTLESLRKHDKKLSKGGIKISEAKAIALKMQEERLRLNLLNMARNSLDSTTAESVAEQDKFNYLVSACTVYSDTGKAYFKDVEDYLNQGGEVVAQKAANNFAQLFYGINDDFEKNLPENKFLIKHKLMDEEFNLLDKQGNKVDDKGNKVAEPEDGEALPFIEDNA
jgi:hypothetical protein